MGWHRWHGITHGLITSESFWISIRSFIVGSKQKFKLFIFIVFRSTQISCVLRRDCAQRDFDSIFGVNCMDLVSYLWMTGVLKLIPITFYHVYASWDLQNIDFVCFLMLLPIQATTKSSSLSIYTQRQIHDFIIPYSINLNTISSYKRFICGILHNFIHKI